MNEILAKNLLFDVGSILSKYKIPYFLAAGTLLGAYRDKNFIKQDNDVDLGIFQDIWNREDFPNIAYDLFDIGIVINNLAANCVLNLIRNDIPMDLYYYKKITNYYRIQGNGWEFRIPEKYLRQLKTMDFLGKQFYIPNYIEEFLDGVYAKNWKFPLSKHDTVYGWNKPKNKVKKIMRFTNFYYVYEKL